MIQIPFNDHLDTKFPCPLKDKHTHKNTFRSTEKLSLRNHTLILPWNKYLWLSWFFMLITLHYPLGFTLLAKIHLICIASYIALSIVWYNVSENECITSSFYTYVWKSSIITESIFKQILQRVHQVLGHCEFYKSVLEEGVLAI